MSLARRHKGLYQRRLWTRTDGNAAVEFALIAAPLVFLLMSCFEMAFALIVSFTLDNATARAAREIRTGITTSGNSSASSFKTEICTNMGWLQSDCNANMQIDVKTYPNFPSVPTTLPVTAGVFNAGGLGYAVGAGSTIQVVSAYYQWSTFTQFLNFGNRSLSNAKVLLVSRFVFRNEPF